MARMICASCGSSTFITDGIRNICQFCNTEYIPEPKTNNGQKRTSSVISVQSDVERLLEKCRTDPSRASRYAGLVLDIDPTNKEAMKYL